MATHCGSQEPRQTARRAALFYHSEADDVIDPGTTHDRSAMVEAARTRDAVGRLEMRSIAARTRAFWQKHANG